ncbi:MAG: type II toxin-antitoxin system VapC family toxin [Bryobacteraceae bacterium]|nr:type II toxin-antitoxin system VapC family toxin [Bryobacteraceae bacterium]
MIVDSSALLAVVFNEPESDRFSKLVVASRNARISAASYLEAATVVDRRGTDVNRAMFDTVVEQAGLAIEPFTAEQAKLARQAYRVFGKGRHPAALNFGDCFSYALAKVYREPILFKGNDFSKTDLLPADSATL